MRRALLIAIAALAVALAAGTASGGPNLVVGTADNTVVNADPVTAAAQFGVATQLGLKAVWITAGWSPGQVAPDPAQLPAYAMAAQQAELLGIRLFLEISPASLEAVPVDDAARAQFAQYARELAVALPQIYDFVIGNQVNSPAYWPQSPLSARSTAVSSAPSYLELLALTYDVLKGVDPSLRVIGGSLSSQDAPGTWVLTLGQAYRKSGRAEPVMDALAIQAQNDSAAQPPSFVHPTGPIDIGDHARLVANLKRAFETTAQPGATLPIVYAGYGVQSTIPAAKASLYTGAETDAVDEATQGAYYAEALQLAACQPNVVALLFRRMADEQDLGGLQSGLLYPDLTPKSSAEAVRAAIDALAAGTPAGCPQAPGTPPAPEPSAPPPPPAPSPAPPPPPQPAPEALTPIPANPQVAIAAATATLGCDRPCYYLAVLQDARGTPLRARQGSVAAGVSVRVTVATQALPAGSYRLTVHLVPRVDPAQGIAREGEPFSVP